ncbi:hypothetical protein CVIRNUC_001627 [Coccomyxa viridis]|uniref:Protein kinase domain-containing protein n=1 Tax=Coccomyxa viridis TaxID=1274662 RepID=A0AAV1HUK4_9CHLO|nr:hypothetical protein CVIRNUC_001627 [Coccomyxa viridis]
MILLSQEADRLRRASSEQDATSSLGERPKEGADRLQEREEATQQAQSSPFGYESKVQEAAVLAEVGEGGFGAQDLELIQQLGALSWVTEVAREDPLQLSRNTVQEQTAVVAFTALYYSGLPFQEPVTVLLKEYLPGARSVACNEMQALVHLAGGLPDRKWHAATAPVSRDLPVVPLLGYFMAGQSEAGAAMNSGRQPKSTEDVLWLVYKFERLQPLSYYAAADQPQQKSALPWGAKAGKEQALADRCRMVRSICKGVLEALAYCHSRSVAHGSLGPGSILLNTFRDQQARELIVKLDNFGFAQLHRAGVPSPLFPSPQSLDPDHPLSLAQKEDLKAAGLTLLETVICSLAEGGPSAATSSDALQRLLCDVFQMDVQAFRRHCNQEPDWSTPAIFLDEFDGAGWALVMELLKGEKSAQELLANEFVLTV